MLGHTCPATPGQALCNSGWGVQSCEHQASLLLFPALQTRPASWVSVNAAVQGSALGLPCWHELLAIPRVTLTLCFATEVGWDNGARVMG